MNRLRVSGASPRGMRWAAACALVLALAAPAGAQDLMISSQWIRSIVPMRPAAGYFMLMNDGAKVAVLVGASSPGCARMMLHQSKTVNGVDKMVHVGKVEVPSHGQFSFAPGGYHIMCMKPTRAVRPGKTVSVTLKFANGSTVTADFPVKNAMGK